AAEQVSWLLDATAAIAKAFGAQEGFVERIEALAERVQLGVTEAVLPLARLHLPELTRSTLAALEAQQLHTAETISEAPEAALRTWMPSSTAHTVRTWAQRNVKRSNTTAEIIQPKVALVVDDTHPGQIFVDDEAVPLQEKQYRLIRTLAAHPGQCVPYDTIYKSVWGDAIVESNQMHFQKRKLLDRIKRAAPHRAKLVTTVPKRGFVLNLSLKEVVVRGESISSAA
ncbi:unnamed protein product, partial [marine sediment metagenome]